MNIRIKAFTFIIAAAACWASCKKNNDKPTILPTASLRVINATNDIINFYQNGTLVNNTSTYFPGGTLSSLLTVKAGLQNYQVKLASPSTPNALFTTPITLDSGKVYSLYVSSRAADGIFFTNDTATAPTNGSAKLRFVNASPDAGPLVLAFVTPVTQVSTPQFSNIAYKTTTDFLNVTPSTTATPGTTLAAGSLILSVYQAGSDISTARKDTVTISTGRIYTVVGYGTIGSGGNQALGTSLIVNQ
ncbi:protein of unknown function [Mucilaginibacter lappiensis]|uniref:DUF4397 domain-containing protein n=1 Tax=Mucilaginibacter lappiensis TaxID=354630 RepID=A0ABR6PM35_9SPHI|nr:DUF4397 domain-containing protein [Mucilaginibacter lappiensis]MBB6110823.1 hypothetical protein [Mucilaginibacter lappiensis]SIR62757.1 protein of unknown function [Mucilaginibacter lappiensis]